MLTELKFAARSLLRTPGLVAVVVMTLAFGIGANTAIFSMVKTALLSPVPYPEPKQLVLLWERSANVDFAAISWPDLKDWREQNQSFAALGGFRLASFRYADQRGPERLSGVQADATLLDALGLEPLIGRSFTRDEDRAEAPGFAMLSHAFWLRRFDGDPNVIGRTLDLDGEAYTVIGVMRPEAQLTSHLGLALQRGAVDVWTQLGRLGNRPEFQDRANHPGILAVGRMKPGVTFDQAMAEMRTISANLKQRFPEGTTLMEAGGAPLMEKAVEGYQSLWLLQGAVGLVLLIACANIATLLTARGAARESELVIQASLGASSGRLMRQLLLESVLLAAAGGLLGVFVAYWAHRGIIALDPPGADVLLRARLDFLSLAVAGALSLTTALMFGVWPARKLARRNARLTPQEGGRASSFSGGTMRARSLLIVSQVALTVILLAGAGLLLKSFMRAQALDLGFDSTNVVTARLELPRDTYGSPEQIRSFTDALLQRARALPGVTGGDIAATLPLDNGWQATYLIDGQTPPTGAPPFAEMNVVSDGYFQTMRIPLLRGRVFGPQDVESGQRVVIIDDASARRYWPDADPIGKTIRVNGTSFVVVGVVPTLRLYGYAREPQILQGYLSLRQNTFPSMSLLVRADQDPTALANAVRGAVREIDGNQPLWDVGTFDDRIAGIFSNMRLYAFLFGVFAALALLLAIIGLYGLLAFQVTCQTREFGIRIALGAQQKQIMLQVIASGVKLLAVGAGVGLVGALLVSQALVALLYRTSALDPMVLTTVIVLLGTVALVACWIPARRVLKVDPMIALRAE